MKKSRALQPNRLVFSLSLILGISLPLLVSGCGVAAGTSTPTTPAPTVSVTATPASITSGASSTLTVTAANASQVTVTGTDGSSYTLSAGGGTQAVTPKSTTTYTASATGAGGNASATATVTVNAAPAPTVSITANPTSVSAGGSSTLTIVAANATQVVVTGTDGSTYNLAATGGNQIVTPTATTTYTAVATGSGGKAVATATVTLITAAPATVTITAAPQNITAGNSTTLTVAATNATQVTITGTDGSSYTLSSTGGTQAVSPASTTTYMATATGTGGNATASVVVTVTPAPTPTVTITASPASIVSGHSSTLTVTAVNATGVTITGSDGSSYTLQSPTGGTQAVSPTSTTTYTAIATGPSGNATATATVTVVAAGSVNSIDHVIFMMQENHSFDNYFGMLNPYRQANNWTVSNDGNTYTVDGIDDKLSTISNEDDEGQSFPLFKLKSTCIDDDSSAWLSSYGDVNRYNFLMTRPILTDGFVHTAEGYAKSCAAANSCAGNFTDLSGQRAMGYYDQGFLNYYYYMASQFALSDRWFSPVSSKTVDNRIATLDGGTTQGLVNDPGSNDHLPQLDITTIFQKLDAAGVSWKIYYTVTEGLCLDEDDCPGSPSGKLPAIQFLSFTYSYKYVYENPSGAPCTGTTQPSSVVGDSDNTFCIDPNHIAPISTYYTDLKNNALPSFAFIEPGYGNNDEHPGSGQSVLHGQAQVASVMNAFMASKEWADSVFFFAYDEGGGPYDHVPPVPGHSNDNTDPSQAASIPDISSIAVNPDSYFPCVPQNGTPTLHCDLSSTDPGANPGDAPAVQGFAAQLGFRVPNFVLSPFVRPHYVSHVPMDHTAIIKFVEDRFIKNPQYLTARDAAQPNLLDFFDFNNVPWATPPTPPAPVTSQSLGYNPCTPTQMGP